MSIVDIHPQPDDVTCGPTCLHALYRFYGEKISLATVIKEVHYIPQGGTLAVFLAIHALKRRYKVTILTYNLQLFDPLWFKDKTVNITERLLLQKKYKKDDSKLQVATDAYLKYLELGGEICFEDLGPEMLEKYLAHGTPLLTGLSSTYLYNCAREIDISDTEMRYDSEQGYPTGHFVIARGISEDRNTIMLSDPYLNNPHAKKQQYSVSTTRFINSIMLGIVTYDANILIIQKPDGK